MAIYLTTGKAKPLVEGATHWLKKKKN
jgi:hypothetical protein